MKKNNNNYLITFKKNIDEQIIEVKDYSKEYKDHLFKNMQPKIYNRYRHYFEFRPPMLIQNIGSNITKKEFIQRRFYSTSYKTRKRTQKIGRYRRLSKFFFRR